jgi:hypothetical protein
VDAEATVVVRRGLALKRSNNPACETAALHITLAVVSSAQARSIDEFNTLPSMANSEVGDRMIPQSRLS